MATYTAPIDDMMFLFRKVKRQSSIITILKKYKEVSARTCKRYLRASSKVNRKSCIALS